MISIKLYCSQNRRVAALHHGSVACRRSAMTLPHDNRTFRRCTMAFRRGAMAFRRGAMTFRRGAMGFRRGAMTFRRGA